MSQTMDAERWPRAAGYAATLPDGLKSFRGCEVHVDVFDHLRHAFPAFADEPGLPDPARQMLKGTYTSQWIPDVVGNLILLGARDRLFKTDQEYSAWALEAAKVTFNKPWTRILMYVLAPTLIIMGVGKRWQAFHHGSELSAEKAIRDGNRMKAHGALTFPKGLFNELLLRRIGITFEAALLAAKASNPSTLVHGITDTRAEFSMTWDP